MTELDVAISVVKLGGEILREAFFTMEDYYDKKSSVDLVTETDKKVEQIIGQQLFSAFPTYGFEGEEGANFGRNPDSYWILDPLDGTTNFTRRFPWFAISLALIKKQELVLGVIYNPIIDELFVAEVGGGAYLNGRKITVSSRSDLQDAVLCSGFYYDTLKRQTENIPKWVKALESSLGVRCDGSAALDLCSVACGRYDGYWERGLSSWDVAAGTLIVMEANGVVTDYEGGQNYLYGEEIVAANSSLHAEILRNIIHGGNR
jgi:myo-inositol-1(or 4)-monophosphatase